MIRMSTLFMLHLLHREQNQNESRYLLSMRLGHIQISHPLHFSHFLKTKSLVCTSAPNYV